MNNTHHITKPGYGTSNENDDHDDCSTFAMKNIKRNKHDYILYDNIKKIQRKF